MSVFLHTRYDAVGNRLYREDVVAAAQQTPVHLDELYHYDDLYQLEATQRGDLDHSDQDPDNWYVDSQSLAQAWSLDATGNWSEFKEGDSEGNWDLDQDRTHSAANEVTSAETWEDPLHDFAGNMTRIPNPADLDDGLTATYDAWNRMVKVENGETVVAEYRYNGLDRRIRKFVPASGSDWTVTEYYQSAGWQVLEVAVGVKTRSGTPLSEPDVATTVREQYVWGLRYVDDLVLRDDDHGTGGGLGKDNSGLDRRLYALQDANWNVVAVAEPDGDVVERYTYTAYGTVEIRSPVFVEDGGGSRDLGWTVLYTGRELDAETGLYYYRARYYSAELGRFAGRDPLGYGTGEVSLYAYCDNSPADSVDPSGLDAALLVPGGHTELAVEVHNSKGDIIGVLTASYGGRDWQAGNRGLRALAKAVAGQQGEVLLSFRRGAKLAGKRIVRGTTHMDNDLVEWILAQVGKDRAWFDKQIEGKDFFGPPRMDAVGNYARYSVGAPHSTCYSFTVEAFYMYKGVLFRAVYPRSDAGVIKAIDALIDRDNWRPSGIPGGGYGDYNIGGSLKMPVPPERSPAIDGMFYHKPVGPY